MSKTLNLVHFDHQQCGDQNQADKWAVLCPPARRRGAGGDRIFCLSASTWQHYMDSLQIYSVFYVFWNQVVDEQGLRLLKSNHFQLLN